MKRPLVPVALCYAAGLLLAKAFQLPLLSLFSCAFILLFLSLAFPRARLLLLWPLLLAAGWTNLVSRTVVVAPHDLRAVIGDSAQFVTLRGTLIETPSLRIFERDDKESYRSVAELDVTSLNRETNWLPAQGRIVVTTIGELPGNFFSGQRVEVTGVLATPQTPIAPGLFNYRAFLAQLGIHYQLKASSTNDWRIREPALTEPPFTDRFLAWAKRTLSRGLPVEDESLRLMW